MTKDPRHGAGGLAVAPTSAMWQNFDGKGGDKMGSLIKYTLYLENVPMETRVSLYDTFDPVSWTGVSCNEDISVIEFFLLANEYFEDYAKLPQNCRIIVQPDHPLGRT